MRGLETLSSTSATPCGRSVTDSSKFILIMPQLLSGRDPLQLPSQALSLACNPDQTFWNQLQSAGTDQRLRPESQNASRETPASLAISIRRQPTGFSESRNRLPVPLRDKSRKFSLLRAQGSQTQFR